MLDAATRVFHAKGYEAASIQDVADELGMLKGSLYYYIDSKEDLLFAIIDEVHRSTMERYERWLTLDDLPTLEQLRAFVTWQIVTYCRDVAKAGVFVNDFRSLSEEHQQQITAERDRYDRVLRDLIRTGQKEGTIDPGVDAKLTSMAVFGMTNWIATWWDPDGPNTPEEVAGQFVDLVLAGLLARPDGSPRSAIAPLPPSLSLDGDEESATA